MRTKIQFLTVPFLVAALTITTAANAQERIITGSILASQAPVEAATVHLLKAKDSTLITSVVSDKTGHYRFAVAPGGNYLVMVEALGYQKQYSAAFSITTGNTFQVPAVQLTAQREVLSGVTVSAKKQMIEQHLDKTVINVDASPSNAGLNVLDVLEKSPGVTVDKDGNVSLKGKDGVLILIDGKPTYLSGTDLANILKNLPSSNLETIEIMPNPPAKYDAAGNSGIINIRTKKSKISGLNGSVTVGGGQGVYPKANNSVNMNYRSGQVNIFGNYGYYWNRSLQDIHLTRKFHDQTTNEVLSVFDQHSYMKKNSTTHSYKAGIDYYVDKKTTVGMVVTGFFNPWNYRNTNTTNISQPDGKLDSVTLAKNTYNTQFNNLGTNLNFRHTFDSTGRELTADLDYVQYTTANSQTFQNIFYDATGNKKKPDEFINGALPSDIHIYSGKADYTHPLKGNAKLEAGVKSSYVQTDNNAQYLELDNASGAWQKDAGRSNHFIYKENINAAYINFSKQLTKKWSSQLGLRAENTNANGNQVTTGETFSRHYTQFFPTAFIGFNPNDKNQMALSYGRRIERPDYEDMNPFYYFLDKYTYQVGNPNLRPQTSHNIELNHTWRGFLTSSIGYSRTSDIILDVLQQVDSITTTYQTKRNIASSYAYTASMSANFPVNKWWKNNIYIQGSYKHFAGILNDQYFSVNGPSFMTNFSSQFQLSSTWNMELSGFYRSSMIEGTLTMRPMGMLSFAVSKQVMNKRGTIRLNVRDFLDLQAFRGYSRYQNVDINIYNQWDNRVLNVSFTYRFSKGQVNTQQRNRGSAGDEQNRVKSDN